VRACATGDMMRGGMEIFPDKRSLVGLVDQAYEGKICLPNFQRDFVWTREEVADLIRSIVRGYFIGSLLLLRCAPANPPFAPVFLRGAGRPDGDPQPSHLVLDGQQRLSSLIYALTAPDLSLKDSSQRRWFFLNLDVLLAEPDSQLSRLMAWARKSERSCAAGTGATSSWSGTRARWRASPARTTSN
jgi:hypothetical protein